MTDPRAQADEAVLHLDRLGAIILDDVGDGPSPADFATAARAARDAVSHLAVPALTRLTGLVASVADSLVAGATEWSPSLGGTLMAAVDDLRHLAARASQFSDEDAEHLSHRAAELSGYASAVAPSEAKEAPRAETMDAPVPLQPEPVAAKSDAAPIVPITQFFYDDAGPHIVSGGGSSKESTTRSDILGKGIDALETLTMRPIAAQVSIGSVNVVPVESLLYHGRAALERAAAIREQIRTSGGAASPAALDEMYDLIGLALKD